MSTLFTSVRRTLLTVGATSCLLFSVILPVSAASTISVTTFGLPNGGFPGTPIKASSGAAAILKLEVTASQASQTFTSVTVNFSGTGFVTTSLATIATGVSSGVALYLDDGGTVNQFDGTDSVITLAASPGWTGNTADITLTPATPVALTSGTAKKIFVVIRTSGTIVSGNQIIAAVGINGVATSDGSGPTAAFSANNYTADTVAPLISKVDGSTGSNSLTVTFSEAVEKVGGGNLSASEFAYVDGGGSAQTLSTVSHVAGQSTATLTMSGNLDSQDFSVPATLAAGSNKIADMAGNAAGTTAVNATSSLKITTATVPSATAGTVYSGTPLVTFAAAGGAGTFTFALADASSTATFVTLGLNLNTNTGAVTGTVANVTGAFNFNLKVTDAAFVTSTKGFTINVAPAGGGGVPGISNVNPPGGTQGASNISVTVTGGNTHFASTSTVEFLMPQGLSGTNGITVSNVSASSTTVLNFQVAIAAGAVMGSRDVKITTGGEAVIMPNGFGVGASGGSGLTLQFPSDSATGVPIPPNFSFSQTTESSVLSYRVTVKTSQDLSGTVPAIWDYVFPQSPTTNGGHCSSAQCNLSYGSGVFRLLTQASALSPNTDYYWQVRTYTTSTSGVSDTVAPLESTAQRKFTTTASVTDTMPPSIFHRPVFQATASTNFDVFARVLDNIANASTTPALTAKILYCAGAGCTPANPTNGASIGAGYYRFTIPSAKIGVASTVIRYSLQSSDGSNTTNFTQPDTSPFQLSSVAAGSSSIAGTVKDGTGTCAAGIQGAVVFAEGSGFSALSNGSCAFTISNIFAGTYDLVAVHDGYADRKIEGVPAGSTGLAMSLPQGQSGGFGG
ncbi:MAG: carboxypeptidase-like regulatory domain-containing protein, partial [Candidatus Uhrbacteria bacterium]|nr:carboxypeptidase-like regulatory domain-containing protein [Candidatus Uhrbacteria bacterium]